MPTVILCNNFQAENIIVEFLEKTIEFKVEFEEKGFIKITIMKAGKVLQILQELKLEVKEIERMSSCDLIRL